MLPVETLSFYSGRLGFKKRDVTKVTSPKSIYPGTTPSLIK